MTEDEHEAYTALTLAVVKLTLVVARIGLPTGNRGVAHNTEEITDLLKQGQDAANRARDSHPASSSTST